MTDSLNKFDQLKNQVQKAEALYDEIQSYKRKQSDAETFISILQNKDIRNKQDRCMLMLSFVTSETGKVHMSLDDNIFHGLIIGMTQTAKDYADIVNKLNLEFDKLIGQN